MDEFALIRRHFVGLTDTRDGVVLGIGDDASLLEVPAGEQLVVTSDTLIAGRHFPAETAPFDIGWKALAVNLSDLAAMGATARWFTLALTLPAVDAVWLQSFGEGLKALAGRHDVALVGGDTTRGELSLTITAMGTLPRGTALRRDGAKPGDCVAVTGTLGDAALALRQWQQGVSLPVLRERLDRPAPRLQAGTALRGIATAAIDLSDGLAGDLGHILAASGVGAEIEVAWLPQSETFMRQSGAEVLDLQLHGGDDYELCLTIPPEDWDDAQEALHEIELSLTRIGVITAEPGLRLREGSRVRTIEPRGFNHFERA